MPLQFSAAHSSRIKKRPLDKVPSLKRSVTSPFADFKPRKPVQRSRSKPEFLGEDDDDYLVDRLDDIGIVRSLATDLSLRDVAQIIQYISSHMFDALPENGGFNSTGIAEILNFRRSLPPTVTVSHVHAMTDSATTVEREIAELRHAGIIRRTVTPGRGSGGSSIAESLILLKDIDRLANDSRELEHSLAKKMLGYLRANPMRQSIVSTAFSASEVTQLMRAGFLTFSRSLNPASAFARPDSASLGTLTSLSNISRAASGSMAAVGGENAICDAGGRRGTRHGRTQVEMRPDEPPQHSCREGEELALSLPNLGQYLKLLTSARSHMISLLMKSRFREMPLYLLRERWDGGISANDPAARAKKYRGEFQGVLPSKTRKWKEFYGLSFEWIFAECLGAGLVELFETGSVGRAIRVI